MWLASDPTPPSAGELVGHAVSNLLDTMVSAVIAMAANPWVILVFALGLGVAVLRATLRRVVVVSRGAFGDSYRAGGYSEAEPDANDRHNYEIDIMDLCEEYDRAGIKFSPRGRQYLDTSAMSAEDAAEIRARARELREQWGIR